MRKFFSDLGAGIGLALLPFAAFATQEEAQESIFRVEMYAFILVVVLVVLGAYFKPSRNKRRASLDRLFEGREAIHSVGPDAPVIECVRTMTTEKIGALIVIDGENLIGIFTERDVLDKVVAAGLDPVSTKVSEVMTKDPCCAPTTTTVNDAMELVAKQRLQYLPIVENGKVLAVVSSGDLIHWLVKDQL